MKPDWNDGLCREILNNGSPSGITIWVYHFSSFVAGAGPVLSEGNRGGGGENTGGGLTGGTMPGQNLLGGGGGGSGCFISTLMKE